MSERTAAKASRPKPKPEDVARVAAARAVAGLPEDAARSRAIAAELAAPETKRDEQ